MQRCWLFVFLFFILFIGCREQKESNSWSFVHADTLNSKFFQAEELMRLGKFREAADAYRQLREKKLPVSESAYARLAEALTYLLTNDSIFIDHEIEPPDDARLNGLYHLILGVNSFHKENSGLTWLNKAKKEFAENKSEGTLHYLITMATLGTYHRIVDGEVDSSIFYFKEAERLAETEKKFQALKPIYLHQLAELSLMVRDTYKGLSYIQLALSGEISPEMRGRLLTSRGTMFRKLRQFDSAEQYYAQAEQLLAKEGFENDLAVLLRERALKAIIVKDPLAFNNTMLQLKQIDSVKRGPEVNLDRLYGYFYFKNEDPEKSIAHYEAAARVLRKQKQLEIVQLGEVYFLLTEQYRELKKFKEAELSCYQALTFNSSLRNTPFEWKNVFTPEIISKSNKYVNLILLADLYLDHYELDHNATHLTRALFMYQAIDSIIGSRVRVGEEDSKLLYGEFSQRVCLGGVRACYHKYQLTKSSSLLNLAHQFLEKSRAMLIYQDMLARQNEYFPDVPEEFKNREFEIKGELARLKNKAQGLSTGELTKAVSDLEYYYQEMKQVYPEYYNSKFHAAMIKPFVYFQELSTSLKSSFIQYQISGQHIYFLTYDSLAQFERIPIDSIDEKRIALFVKQISQPQINKFSQRDLAIESNFIYEKLIRPVHLSKPNLVIVADGNLSRLPFEVLARDTVSKNFSHCLLYRYNVSYAHSLKSYDLSSRNKIVKCNSILGYSYSSGSQGQTGGLSQLPGSYKELQVIKDIFRESKLRLKSGGEATGKQFFKDLNNVFDIAHLALHASASISNKLDNKIYFNSPRANDVIYGYDLATKKIQADLVVLTGCETSSGPWIKGEGTYSLTRSLKQAGAKNVIASLWSLPDQSSVALMKPFYENLKKGKPIDICLREAKINYLSTADEFTSHPYFWASLISF